MGAWLFRSRMLVLTAAFVTALGLAFTQRFWASHDLLLLKPLARWSEAPWALDAVLVASGLCLLLAFLVRTLSEARLREVVYGQGQVDELVRSGPFAWLRNPLYLGTWLFFFGAVALWAPAFLWLLLSVILFAMLDAMVGHEEGMLAEQLGAEYQAYREQVARWLPRPPARPDDSGGVSARALGWAAVGNLGLCSLGLFRLAVALGAPARIVGAVNLLCIGLWLLVVLKRRRGAVSSNSG